MSTRLESHTQADSKPKEDPLAKQKKKELSQNKNQPEEETKNAKTAPHQRQEGDTKFEYHCYEWRKNLLSESEVEKWPECESEFIEQKGVKEDTKGKSKLNIQNLFKAFTNKSLNAIEQMYYSIGEVGYGIADVVKSGKKQSNPQFKKTLSELGSIKDLVVLHRKKNIEGNEANQEVKLGDLFIPLIRKFGLMDKDNENNPATDHAINKLQEVDVTKDDYEESKDSKEKLAPNCSICSSECEKKAIKTDCGHFFHKDCLVPWLKIHNRCPDCSQIVAK